MYGRLKKKRIPWKYAGCPANTTLLCLEGFFMELFRTLENW